MDWLKIAVITVIVIVLGLGGFFLFGDGCSPSTTTTSGPTGSTGPGGSGGKIPSSAAMVTETLLEYTCREYTSAIADMKSYRVEMEKLPYGDVVLKRIDQTSRPAKDIQPLPNSVVLSKLEGKMTDYVIRWRDADKWERELDLMADNDKCPAYASRGKKSPESTLVAKVTYSGGGGTSSKKHKRAAPAAEEEPDKAVMTGKNNPNIGGVKAGLLVDWNDSKITIYVLPRYASSGNLFVACDENSWGYVSDGVPMDTGTLQSKLKGFEVPMVGSTGVITRADNPWLFGYLTQQDLKWSLLSLNAGEWNPVKDNGHWTLSAKYDASTPGLWKSPDGNQCAFVLNPSKLTVAWAKK